MLCLKMLSPSSVFILIQIKIITDEATACAYDDLSPYKVHSYKSAPKEESLLELSDFIVERLGKRLQELTKFNAEPGQTEGLYGTSDFILEAPEEVEFIDFIQEYNKMKTRYGLLSPAIEFGLKNLKNMEKRCLQKPIDISTKVVYDNTSLQYGIRQSLEEYCTNLVVNNSTISHRVLNYEEIFDLCQASLNRFVSLYYLYKNNRSVNVERCNSAGVTCEKALQSNNSKTEGKQEKRTDKNITTTIRTKELIHGAYTLIYNELSMDVNPLSKSKLCNTPRYMMGKSNFALDIYRTYNNLGQNITNSTQFQICVEKEGFTKRLEDKLNKHMNNLRQELDKESKELSLRLARELTKLQNKHKKQIENKTKQNLNAVKKVYKMLYRHARSRDYKNDAFIAEEREMLPRDVLKRIKENHSDHMNKEDNRRRNPLIGKNKEISVQDNLRNLELKRFVRYKLLELHALEEKLLHEELKKRRHALEETHSMLFRHLKKRFDLKYYYKTISIKILEAEVNWNIEVMIKKKKSQFAKIRNEIYMEQMEKLQCTKEMRKLKRKTYKEERENLDTYFKERRADLYAFRPQTERDYNAYIAAMNDIKDEETVGYLDLEVRYSQYANDIKHMARWADSFDGIKKDNAVKQNEQLVFLNKLQNYQNIENEIKRKKELKMIEENTAFEKSLLDRKIEIEMEQFNHNSSKEISLLLEKHMKELEVLENE